LAPNSILLVFCVFCVFHEWGHPWKTGLFSTGRRARGIFSDQKLFSTPYNSAHFGRGKKNPAKNKIHAGFHAQQLPVLLATATS
jgi:hypothetical protein